MSNLEDIKKAKVIGKQLRKVRELQGHNLAVLAASLKLSVVELVAIEDGNLFVFNSSIDQFMNHANQFAELLGVNISPEINTL